MRKSISGKPSLGLVMLLMIVVSSGCTHDNKENKSTADTSETTEQKDITLTENIDTVPVIVSKIDIPVAVNIGHDDKEHGSQYIIVDENENEISIDINSEYYNQYKSGNRFTTPLLPYFQSIDDIEYLTLELDIVNDTKQRISVNELDINVENSKLDKNPYIYICTQETNSNSITFVNGSWHNWKGFTFSYSILKDGQRFSGKYDKSIHIPYFDIIKTIDLLPDLKNLGYDFDGLIEWIHRKNIEEDPLNNNPDPWISEYGDQYLLFETSPETFRDEVENIKKKFYPFSLKNNKGYATLYGSIQFDQTDIVKNFIAEISLSTEGGFGDFAYENDEFDVKLQTSGESYMKRFPYTTVIESQGSEMVKLTIMTDKSSNHKFFIDVINDNGLTIRSKNIHLHTYVPNNNDS